MAATRELNGHILASNKGQKIIFFDFDALIRAIATSYTKHPVGVEIAIEGSRGSELTIVAFPIKNTFSELILARPSKKLKGNTFSFEARGVDPKKNSSRYACIVDIRPEPPNFGHVWRIQ